jgi:hypothetical protein
MLDLAQAVREQIVKETPPRKTTVAPKTFTLRKLRSFTVWTTGAAAAFALAVLSARSQSGSERLVAMFHGGGRAQQTAAKFDAETVTRQLADAVRVLASNDEQLRGRVAVVEHDLDDVTGSIRQVAAASEARRTEEGPTVSATAALTTSAPVTLDHAPPLPAPVAAAVPAPETTAPAAPAGPPPTQYGIDIGSGLTLQALRARWQSLRAAHPALLEGLQPIASVKETPHGSKIELRLVAGPLAQSGAASQLCAALTLFGMYCQPTVYDGQHLAQR